MILKLLLVIAVIATIYFIFFKKKEKSKVIKKDKDANDMVECSVCGIYSEIDDSILSNGKYYCSNECLREAR